MMIYTVIQFRSKLNEPIVNSAAEFTKLGGKTYSQFDRQQSHNMRKELQGNSETERQR